MCSNNFIRCQHPLAKMLSSTLLKTLKPPIRYSNLDSLRIVRTTSTMPQDTRPLAQRIKKHDDSIFTVPNILTISRICVTPAVGYFIMTGQNTNALACFAFAATTDALDGFIARRFKQQSDIGQMLDPLADKLLLSTSLVALCYTDVLPFWFVKGMIYREILLLGGGGLIRYFAFEENPGIRKFFDFKNHPTRGFEPTFVAKCNTALLCGVVGTHLAFHHLSGSLLYDYGTATAIWMNTFTATYAFIQYLWRAYRTNLERPIL